MTVGYTMRVTVELERDGQGPKSMSWLAVDFFGLNPDEQTLLDMFGYGEDPPGEWGPIPQPVVQ